MSTPVNMGTKIVRPTVESVQAGCVRAREFIESHHLCLEAIIPDYPIGRRDRGKCCLKVERARGKGYRTVKTTTDKFGRWCQPKKSTYRNDITVVVDDLECDKTTGWLGLSEWCLYVSYASGDGFHIVEAPCRWAPRREDEKVVIQMQPIWPPGAPGKEETYTLPADPPELCDAWDVWIERRKRLYDLLAQAWRDCCVPS
jgi:hypothetical protein